MSEHREAPLFPRFFQVLTVPVLMSNVVLLTLGVRHREHRKSSRSSHLWGFLKMVLVWSWLVSTAFLGMYIYAIHCDSDYDIYIYIERVSPCGRVECLVENPQKQSCCMWSRMCILKETGMFVPSRLYSVLWCIMTYFHMWSKEIIDTTMIFIMSNSF